MNHDFHQYMGGFGDISNSQDNSSSQLYRFQPYGYENSPIFENFIDDPGQFKGQHLGSFKKEEKKLEPTNDVPRVSDASLQTKTSFYSQPQHQISIPSEVVELYRKIFHGRKDDTMELCINFKTMIVAFFKERELLNELSYWEKHHISEFNQRSPSLKSISIFFEQRLQNNNIRMLCQDFFSSSECILRILRSRCRMETKLQMIKFIEKMRINISSSGHITKWKDVIKRSIH